MRRQRSPLERGNRIDPRSTASGRFRAGGRRFNRRIVERRAQIRSSCGDRCNSCTAAPSRRRSLRGRNSTVE